MPLKKTIQKARKAKREGKAPSTQAGEFVRETIEDIRHGKHGARFHQASDCHWTFQSATSRRESPSSQEGRSIRENPAECETRY